MQVISLIGIWVRTAVEVIRRDASSFPRLVFGKHILGVTTMRVRFFTVLLGCCLCGCATTQDYHYYLVQHSRAASAWKQTYGRLSHECSRDYKDGWKQGYYDLSIGQCEEPPPVPPHKYWNPKYQSLEGKQAIADWYSGWQDGAAAAVQDGTPYFHEVAVSPTPPVNNLGPHQFHSGEAAHSQQMLEKLPPVPPSSTHTHQPEVHVGPVQPKFASQELEGELLDDSNLPPEAPAPIVNIDEAPRTEDPAPAPAEPIDPNAPPPVDVDGSYDGTAVEDVEDEAPVGEYE